MRNAAWMGFLSLMILGCSEREAPSPGRHSSDPTVSVVGPDGERLEGEEPRVGGREEEAGARVETAAWVDLFDGASLEGIDVTRFGGEGEVWIKEGQVILESGMLLTGIGWPSLELPASFDLEVTAARLSGTDFFCALTFPVGTEHATAVLGGWGGATTGLSCVDGEDASDNETRTFRDYKDGQAYVLRVSVDERSVSATLDGETLFSVDRNRRFEVRPEVRLSCPVGIASFATRASISGVRWRARSCFLER